jgi:hypothetical protein
MRRLHVDQPVTVSLDEEPVSITCRVLDVQGSAGRLAYSGNLPPRAIGRLALGSAGYLVFEEFRMAVGLRVAVRTSPPYLDVAVIDGVALPERRRGERVKLVTRVRITHSDSDDGERSAEWTETINVSERGLLLRHHPALDGRESIGIELMFGDDPQPIAAQTKVVRRLPNAVGVVFDSIREDEATRLGEYLMGIRHQRQRRPS